MTVYKIKTIHVKLKVNDNKAEVSSAEMAYDVAKSIYSRLDEDQEHFILLSLDSENAIKGYKIISSGSMTSADVDLRIVFRNALLLGAVSIILVHNHPSGSSNPSKEDREFNTKIVEAGDMLGIRVLDHIILGNKGYSII